MDIVLIWVNRETIYFFEQDWTASIRLIGLNKSGQARRALGANLRLI
jgi:hypothetical protein